MKGFDIAGREEGKISRPFCDKHNTFELSVTKDLQFVVLVFPRWFLWPKWEDFRQHFDNLLRFFPFTIFLLEHTRVLSTITWLPRFCFDTWLARTWREVFILDADWLASRIHGILQKCVTSAWLHSWWNDKVQKRRAWHCPVGKSALLYARNKLRSACYPSARSQSSN